MGKIGANMSNFVGVNRKWTTAKYQQVKKCSGSDVTDVATVSYVFV